MIRSRRITGIDVPGRQQSAAQISGFLRSKTAPDEHSASTGQAPGNPQRRTYLGVVAGNETQAADVHWLNLQPVSLGHIGRTFGWSHMGSSHGFGNYRLGELQEIFPATNMT